MKKLIGFLLIAITLFGCHGLNPTIVYPPHHDETLALNKSLRNKFIGTWEYIRLDSGHIDTVKIELNADSSFFVKEKIARRDSIVKKGKVIYGDWIIEKPYHAYSQLREKKGIWKLIVTDKGNALYFDGYLGELEVNGKKYGITMPPLYFDGITDDEIVMQKLFFTEKVVYRRVKK